MSERLTTTAGAPVADNQNTLTAGPRGPVLLEDCGASASPVPPRRPGLRHRCPRRPGSQGRPRSGRALTRYRAKPPGNADNSIDSRN
jgi:hypothetical protein